MYGNGSVGNPSKGKREKFLFGIKVNDRNFEKITISIKLHEKTYFNLI